MRRVLLVAETTGYQTRVFEEAAARLAVELVYATDCCRGIEDPWGDHAVSVRFDQPEPAAKAVARRGPFDGIVAVGDRPAYLASLIAARLGLRFSPPDAVLASRNKFLMRDRLWRAGMSVPRYYRVPLEENPELAAEQAPYPCVLKPLGLSASRGVIRADTPAQFVAAFERIRTLLASPDILRRHEDQDRYLQVETFISGREYALEGIVTGGRLQVLALFDKPDPLDGPFFEETIYVTPSREPPEAQHALIETAQQAVNALGLSDSPLHAEMRVNEQGVWMLEAAARPIGGLCARALRFDVEMSLEELILRHALGEDVSGYRRERCAAGVMMIPIPQAGIYRGVSGVEEASAVAGVQEVMITAKEGQKLLPLPEGSSYLGFLFARAGTAEAVVLALRKAHRSLAFEIMSSLPVVQ